MRTYGEVIDVRTAPVESPRPLEGDGCSGAPEQFLWRGRLYLVRDVLAQWVELGTWWSVRGAASRPGPRPTPRPGADRGATGSPGEAGDGGSRPRSVAADVGSVEREVWRVEAAAGRGATPGVYDLVRDVRAHDPGTGLPAAGPDRWRLARALD